MTAPAPKSREEWEKEVGRLAVSYRDFAFAEAGLGKSAEDENQCWDKYASEKATFVDSIMALQSEVERVRELIPPGYDLDFMESQVPKIESALHKAHEGRGGGASIPCCPNHAWLYKIAELVHKMVKVEKARQPK